MICFHFSHRVSIHRPRENEMKKQKYINIRATDRQAKRKKKKIKKKKSFVCVCIANKESRKNDLKRYTVAKKYSQVKRERPPKRRMSKECLCFDH